jgi:demethylmenaquinone methyltransferase/2-methoxy-6-polyprenyl-1,4-benzoquinol methylase
VTPRLRDLDLDRHLADPSLRQHFVTPMFDLIAPRYDAFTRVFSYGMDRGWKRTLVAEVAARVSPGAHVVDLACGTGDIAFSTARAVNGAQVTGIDASPNMIQLAQARAATAESSARFELGDMTRLAFADASVDAITAGYAFRNVPDHHAALREAARVLKPGGVMVTLDFYRPEYALWRTLFMGYLRVAGNFVGWLWHREPVAYGYISKSIDAFVSAPEFANNLRSAGFDVTGIRTYLLGGVAIHVASPRTTP